MTEGTAADWDIIVIGGGITGAGILREAVNRGYRCLLVEQRDFAWGTSSRSSKMVHGGFRYLASGNFKLTRHALLERERLISEAPGLVTRLGYFFPLYKNQFPPRFAARLLFWLYDRIAGIRNHHRVSNRKLSEIFNQINTTELNGAFYYTDAVTDDARLVLRVLQEATDAGGMVRNYSKATGLLRNGGRVTGIRLQDTGSDESLELKARVVINATGAWANRLAEEPEAGLTIRPQRGSHIVLCAEKFPVKDAIFLVHPRDSRRLFVYPWEGRTIIGTTDIYHPMDLDIAASITREELDYLLVAANQLFSESPPAENDIISTWSGVRPIITTKGSGDPSKASREHKVWVEEGMVSCSGGKMTTFHHMALDVIKKAQGFLPQVTPTGYTRMFEPVTASGGDVLPSDPATGEAILGRFGERARELLNHAAENEAVPLAGTGTCLAELRWSIMNEAVVHLDDLMLRRTRLGNLMHEGGEAVLDSIKPILMQELGWDEVHWSDELKRYRGIINQHYSVPGAVGSAPARPATP